MFRVYIEAGLITAFSAAGTLRHCQKKTCGLVEIPGWLGSGPVKKYHQHFTVTSELPYAQIPAHWPRLYLTGKRSHDRYWTAHDEENVSHLRWRVSPSPALSATGCSGVIHMGLLNIIRRMPLREKLSVRANARRTGLSRNTITKNLNAGTIKPPLCAHHPLPSARSIRGVEIRGTGRLINEQLANLQIRRVNVTTPFRKSATCASSNRRCQ